MSIEERLAYHQNRLQQMLAVAHIRPFWQFTKRCGDTETRRITLLATDPFWNEAALPWRCRSEHCDCRVNSLSGFELAKYIADGCSPGDEHAALMYAEWQVNNR